MPAGATPNAATLDFDASGRPVHDRAFRLRRFFNWFPLGLTYALLYMGRYNLTVAKNALGERMTNEDFGIIFTTGTWVYALSFVFNGPLTDKLGGKRAILIAAAGSLTANAVMGLFSQQMLTTPALAEVELRWWFSLLYGLNMYFQSFAAVAIVKVNASWFHVRERGSFSGIFGTMISSGLFLAFTVNGWLLEVLSKNAAGSQAAVWWVFYAPAMLLAVMFVVELLVLKDHPSQAGLTDFDPGDGSAGEDTTPLPVGVILQRIFTNPVILTIAFIEFCTGVLRNGVLQWFTVFAKQVWVLPSSHPLVNGSVNGTSLLAGAAGLAVGLVLAGRGKHVRNAGLVLALLGLLPFLPAGWGGFSFAAGVFGANAAGLISDLFFQSRRAPAAGGLYALMAICTALMVFALGSTTTRVGWVKKADGPLQVGDQIVSVAGVTPLNTWADVSNAFACVQAPCAGKAQWDTARCLCSEKPVRVDGAQPLSTGVIALQVLRNGAAVEIPLPDPAKLLKAGDKRILPAGPELTLDPIWLAILVFILSFSVIGTHGLLSGTASMDFGGRRATATAVGMIDGFVYLGTGLQSLALGYITSRDWTWWPVFLVPFAVLGFYLCTRIWHAKPGKAGAGH